MPEIERQRYIPVSEAEYAKFIEELLLLRAEVAKLQEEALTNRVSGIPNDKAFEEYLRRVAEIYKRKGRGDEKITIVYGDLKGFKSVNDNFGDQTGNNVLHEVGISLTGVTRPEEITCHMWGDSFAIVLLTAGKKEVSSAKHRFKETVSSLEVPSADPRRPGIIRPKIVLNDKQISVSESFRHVMQTLAKDHFEKPRDPSQPVLAT